MAPPEAAAPSLATSQACNTPLHASEPPATKSLVKRDFDLALRAFFPAPTAATKFNPITAMKQLLKTMLKDKSSLVIRTSKNDKQIILASASIPTGKTEFKKFFKVSTVRNEQQKKSHMCIGCHVLSNRNLGNIKFRSTDSHLLAWLKKERVFVEADSLGIDRPVTVGHFIKIAPELTNLRNFRKQLLNQLMLIDIDADTAIDLAPHLKDAQLEAMTNGDNYIPILPNFELYKTRITHGRDDNQVATDVIGVKGTPQDARLLGEFFTRMASETSNDHRDGIFLPKGAVHQLGPKTYEQVLQENNFFLTQVATVPVNLEYDAWFAVMDSNETADNEPIFLYEHLICKPWFQRIKSAGPSKCLIVTTRPNLPDARNWIDENLEALIRKSLPPDIELPSSSSLPRRLDKPIYTPTSKSYADVLKQQFSLSPTQTTPTTANNRPPPRKRQATTIIDYDSDQSPTSPPLATVPSPSYPRPATMPDYAAELLSIKSELADLRNFITSAVAELKNAIVSLPAPCHPSTSEMETSTSSKMETEVEHPTTTTPDFSDLIAGLKHDIATKLDISDLIADLKLDIALIKSHPLFCNLRPVNHHLPVT